MTKEIEKYEIRYRSLSPYFIYLHVSSHKPINPYIINVLADLNYHISLYKFMYLNGKIV